MLRRTITRARKPKVNSAVGPKICCVAAYSAERRFISQRSPEALPTRGRPNFDRIDGGPAEMGFGTNQVKRSLFAHATRASMCGAVASLVRARPTRPRPTRRHPGGSLRGKRRLRGPIKLAPGGASDQGQRGGPELGPGPGPGLGPAFGPGRVGRPRLAAGGARPWMGSKPGAPSRRKWWPLSRW